MLEFLFIFLILCVFIPSFLGKHFARWLFRTWDRKTNECDERSD